MKAEYYPIEGACEVAEVSTLAYYAWATNVAADQRCGVD